jgi:hypothetical protein
MRTGDVYLARADFDEAERAYRELLSAQPEAVEWVNAALAEVEVQRARAGRARWSWVVVVLFLAAMLAMARRDSGSWCAAGRAMARPPTEVFYLFPVSGGLIAVSLASNSFISHAVIFISVGALAVTWISGAVAEGRRRSTGGTLGHGRALFHAAAAALAIAAICYLALAEERLLDMLLETLRSGPDS